MSEIDTLRNLNHLYENRVDELEKSNAELRQALAVVVFCNSRGWASINRMWMETKLDLELRRDPFGELTIIARRS